MGPTVTISMMAVLFYFYFYFFGAAVGSQEKSVLQNVSVFQSILFVSPAQGTASFFALHL
jgi:hypothetical protein